jgi:hypothetical protein
MPLRADQTMARVSIKRAYDDPEPEDGYRVLVDRIWPRGRSRESAFSSIFGPRNLRQVSPCGNGFRTIRNAGWISPSATGRNYRRSCSRIG